MTACPTPRKTLLHLLKALNFPQSTRLTVNCKGDARGPNYQGGRMVQVIAAEILGIIYSNLRDVEVIPPYLPGFSYI